MPTFSEIAITFTDGFEVNTATPRTYVQYINTLTGTSTLINETVVVSRTQAGEFEAAATAELQAQKYKDALDLDIVPSGDWDVSILGAVVTIKSTIENIQFTASRAGLPNEERFISVINNYTIPIDRTDGLLPARSNYYVSAPIADPLVLNQTVKIWVNSGAVAADPYALIPAFQFTQLRPSVDWDSFDLAVSQYARGFISPSLPTFTDGVVTSPINNNVLVSVSTRNNLQATDQPVLNQVVTTLGYSKYSEGAQRLYQRDILLSSTRGQVRDSDMLVIPVNTTLVPKSIILNSDAGNPLRTITTNIAVNASEAISYAVFDLASLDLTGMQYIVVNDTHRFNIIHECINPTETVYFLNRFGAFEGLTFFKERVDTLEVERFGAFKNNYVKGGAFDTKRHLYRSGESNGRESIRLSSGYVHELQNAAFEDLLLSDYVYLSSGVPLNVDTRTLEKKTRVVDKLINYDITFKVSADSVQVV